MKNNFTKILLISILALALFLRVYKLESVPPSISWDEAAVGYNGFTIASFGRDGYGKFFPFFFRSFADDKHPIHVYITALSVKLLGLSEFSVRFPAAVFGVLNVGLIFLLARVLFKSTYLGLIASFFLAISPYNLHFSHFNHEANFALFFFMLGLTLFYYSIKEQGYLLPLSALSFALCFITYHPSKIIVPLTLILLVVLYARQLKRNKKGLLVSLAIGLLFLLLIISNPQLLGIARINQTSQGSKEVEKTRLFQLTHNQLFGRVGLVATQYSWHFSPQFLFISGDKNPRLSSQSVGEFYKLDALFLILGMLYLLVRRTRESFLLLGLALIAPLPSSMVADAPHAGRAMFMMGSWHIIAAAGFYSLVTIFKKSLFRWGIIILCLSLLTFSLKDYLIYYYGEYTKRYAIEWQYGMKQIVEFVKQNPQYGQVFVTDARSQPYIFFLYYLNTPLQDYLNTVIYNNSKSRSDNNVLTFNKYYFGGWDPIEILPNNEVLYIITPSQYDGLRHKLSFDVKKIIYYPNDAAAYYIVSAKP